MIIIIIIIIIIVLLLLLIIIIIIIIIIISVPPELTTYPINQTKIEGENVTFTCDATGNPEPIFLWTKDGAAVNTTLKISFSSDIKRLFITNVNRADSGEYVCRATNYIGDHQSNLASLNVYCKNILCFSCFCCCFCLWKAG